MPIATMILQTPRPLPQGADSSVDGVSQGNTTDAEAIQAWVCAHSRVDETTIPVLRACLKRSRSGETPHHQVDHSDSDPRLGGCRQRLEVFTQPPRAIEPAERAFHDPAPLQDSKALRVPGAFHDREGPLQHRRHPRDELARIPHRPRSAAVPGSGRPMLSGLVWPRRGPAPQPNGR